VACIYDVTEKCKGMLTPKRFNILYKAFHDTKVAGIHDMIMPPPKSFASERLGLLSRSALHYSKTPMNAKIKHSSLMSHSQRLLIQILWLLCLPSYIQWSPNVPCPKACYTLCHSKQDWNSHIHVPTMLGRTNEYQPLFQTSQRLTPYMLHSRDYLLI